MAAVLARTARAELWKRHAVDAGSFRGADGVRLADFDHDGLLDICTGWEESGVVRLYLNPGPQNVHNPWPAVTVGETASPEDAVPMDIDGDGTPEIISCHEGRARRVVVHRCDAGESNRRPSRSELLDAANWSSKTLEQLEPQRWMFAVPIRLSDNQQALVIGSKGQHGSISILRPRHDQPLGDVSQWKPRRLRDAGWIMTLQAVDMDGDDDDDLLYSDRKGAQRAVGWLEQPDVADEPWTDHRVATDQEFMFIDGDRERILVATRDGGIINLVQVESRGWHREWWPNPPRMRLGKAVRRLGQGHVVLTANTAADRDQNPGQPGLWLRDSVGQWSAIDTAKEVKLDRIECLDLNGDGFKDVLTCEERQNLGVVWYENPGIGEASSPSRQGPGAP